jgi:hypothetical protein
LNNSLDGCPAKKQVVEQDNIPFHEVHLIAKLAAKYEDRPNAHLVVEANYDYCDIFVRWSRLETDEEFKIRLAKEEEASSQEGNESRCREAESIQAIPDAKGQIWI